MSEEKSCAFKTSIGGQALMEGILMRGPEKQAIVIRKPDGTLEEKVEGYSLPKDKYPILGLPIIRGAVNFVDTMIKGVKAMMYSAEFLPEEEQGEPDKLDLWIQKHFPEDKAQKVIVGVAVALGIALSVGLFILLPTILAGLVAPFVGNGILRNLIEGLFRIVIFLSYLILVSRMKEIKRVWMYHGAEHKTIFCYEAGLPLTVENARKQPRLHPRCGTSFLLIVMVVSILVFSLVRWSNVWVRMLMRILLLPLTVGISYEIIKYAGRHDNALTRIISAPGKALQLITTAEPDDSMLEVAIRSLELVRPEERGAGDSW
ncbi:MAG: DUF1385 domain-containing protein [Oscillospiraceae bacterium]|nr:DUF1385 domain-containing protein [Oscillospiraceae bacterium]